MDRKTYLKKKSTYTLLHSLLIVFRGLGLLAILGVIVLVSYYTSVGSDSQQFVEFYDKVEGILRIILFFILACWLILKIINVIFRRKLFQLKMKLGITDEI